MLTIQDVDTNALLKDAAVLAKRDSSFNASFDRYCLSGLRMRLVWSGMVALADEKRPVPWSGDEIIAEIRRRKAVKAAVR